MLCPAVRVECHLPCASSAHTHGAGRAGRYGVWTSLRLGRCRYAPLSVWDNRWNFPRARLGGGFALIGIPHIGGGKRFFSFTEFVKACMDECGAFAEFLIDRHRHCTLSDEPLLTAVPKSERSLALGGEARMGSANGDSPDDRHKSFFVGSFRLNEERYFQFVFFSFFFCRFFLNFLCLQRYRWTSIPERCWKMKDEE